MFSGKAVSNSSVNTVNDIYFKNTIFLLHSDGTNGANNTTYVDNSSYAGVISRGALLNSQGSFSPHSPTGWSMYFNGTTDALSFTATAAGTIGTGDFTVECWTWMTAALTLNNIFFTIGSTNAPGSLSVFSTSPNLYVRINNNLDTVITTLPSLNVWTHVAVVRISGVINVYYNGTVQPQSSSTSPGTTITGTTCVIAYDGANAYWPASYFSNFRIVVGTGVYTGNFTPPTSALSTTQTSGSNISAISSGTAVLLNLNRWYDASGNDYQITVSGTPYILPFTPFTTNVAYASGLHGGSIYHASATDWVGTTTAVILTANSWPQLGLGGEDFSIEFWAYPLTNTSTAQYFFSNYSADTNQRGLRLGFSGTTGAAVLNFNGANVITNSIQRPIYAYSWTHLAVARKNFVLKVFQNGQLVATVADTYSYNIPAFTVASSSYARAAAVIGYTCDVRVVRGSVAYFDSNFTPPTAALSAYAGGTTSDTVLLLNGNNGSLIDATGRNNITYGAAGGATIPSINTTNKKFGTGGVGLMGAGFLRIPNNAMWDFGSGDWIIDFWFYPTTITSLQTIFSKKAAAAGFGPVQVNVTATSKLSTLISTSGAATTQTLTSVASVVINTWHYIAIYRNGVSVVQHMILASAAVDTQTNGTLSTTALAANTADFTIGNQSNAASQPMLGYVDEFRVTKGSSRGYTTSSLPPLPTAAFPNQ